MENRTGQPGLLDGGIPDMNVTLDLCIVPIGVTDPI